MKIILLIFIWYVDVGSNVKLGCKEFNLISIMVLFINIYGLLLFYIKDILLFMVVYGNFLIYFIKSLKSIINVNKEGFL